MIDFCQVSTFSKAENRAKVETGMTVHSVSWIPCSNRLVAAGSNLKNQGTIQVKGWKPLAPSLRTKEPSR